MKKVLIISLVTFIGLGSFAQSFVLDTTFQPFFDIRAQRGAIINGMYEEFNSGKLYAIGEFRSFHNGAFFDGIVPYNNLGQLSPMFSFGSGTGNALEIFTRITSNRFHLSSGGVGIIIDSSGNQSFSNMSWRINGVRTVSCDGGRPYFFPDGSSLFANGRDNTGKACKIIQGTDTFPGRHIIKLTPQGLWDSTFNHDATYGNPIGFFPYDSNRIIIYGNPFRFTHYDSIPIEGMCRIYLDGTLDTTFTSPVNPNFFWGSLRPQLVDNLGRFFITGNVYLKGNTNRIPLVRILANGAVDPSFQYTNGAIDTNNNFGSTSSIVKTSDASFLVGGFFNKYQGFVKKSIVKLDSNGVVEPQYFTSLGPDSADPFLFSNFPGLISQIIPSKFGGYYVGGNFLKWDGQASQPLIKITGMNGGVPVGLNENLSASTIAQHDKLKVYPNPTIGLFNVESEVGTKTIEVYNLSGQRCTLLSCSPPPDQLNSVVPVLSPRLSNEASLYSEVNKIQLNLTNFPKGIYFVKVALENGEVITKKIVKH